MKFKDDGAENIIQFEHFKKLSSEYEYRHKIVKELQAKKDKLWYQKEDLSKDDQNNLVYSEGYCRGHISAIHEIMDKLSVYTKEVQIQALENMKKSVSEDIDSSLRSLKNQLEESKFFRTRRDKTPG